MPRGTVGTGLSLGAILAASVAIWTSAAADVPDETFTALGLSRNASPKQLYDALVARYNDPAQGAGKGKFGDLWEPIPISRYLNPRSFYQPPADVDVTTDRAGCVECHEQVTPGWVHAWKGSVHANLSTIRSLPPNDPRAYKLELLQQVEDNLRSMGMLGEREQLAEVGCIDCHVGIGAKTADHAKDLRMPDAAVCGTCHLQEFAEHESQRDTLNWPHNQWPAGRPSHALDYLANVETAIWVGMEEREIAEGCTMCHTNQNKCDNCHTRHAFRAAEARRPEACSICHNGVDHNEYENFLLSKHGNLYQALGEEWDWEVPLAQAAAEGGQRAPTCAFCHFEYNGNFGHNLVRKVRWAFNPTPAIADNLDHPWFTARKEAWIGTCSNCHSPRFARAAFDLMDNAIKSGLKVEQEAKHVVEALYQEGLLRGQKTNRPAPPAPETDSAGGFFQLFWAKGNNATAVEAEYVRMWENDLIKLYKGVAHVNPGGWTYSEGWAPLLLRYNRIKDADAELRQWANLEKRVAELEARRQGGLFELDPKVQKASAGGLGGAMILAGIALLWSWRRRRQALSMC